MPTAEIDPILRDMSSELLHLRQQLSELRQTFAERERQLGDARQGRAGSEQAVTTLKGLLTDMVLKGRAELQSAQVDAQRSMAERLASARYEAETLVADAAAALATALGQAIDEPQPPSTTQRRADEERPPTEAAVRGASPPLTAHPLPDDAAPPDAARPVDQSADAPRSPAPRSPAPRSPAPRSPAPPSPAPPSPAPPWPRSPRPGDAAPGSVPGTPWPLPGDGVDRATSVRRPAEGTTLPGFAPPSEPRVSSRDEAVAGRFGPPTQQRAHESNHTYESNGRSLALQVAELDLDEQFTKVVGLKPNTEFKTPPRGMPAVAAAPHRVPGPPSAPGPPTVPVHGASAPSAGPAEDAFDAFWPSTPTAPRVASAGPRVSERLHFGVIDVLLPIVALTLILVVVLSWLA